MLHSITSYQCSAPYAESGNDAYMMITIVCQYPPGLHTQEAYHNGVEWTECSFWVIGTYTKVYQRSPNITQITAQIAPTSTWLTISTTTIITIRNNLAYHLPSEPWECPMKVLVTGEEFLHWDCLQGNPKWSLQEEYNNEVCKNV